MTLFIIAVATIIAIVYFLVKCGEEAEQHEKDLHDFHYQESLRRGEKHWSDD